MTDAHREESEDGKYSLWVYVKNWITDYLKSTDLNLDESKNLGVNVKTITEEDPDAATKKNPCYYFAWDGDGRLQYIYYGDGIDVWEKTLEYNAGKLSSISTWVKQ